MKKSLVLGLDKDQKRKEKPALVAQLTLLDIVASVEKAGWHFKECGRNISSNWL